MINKKKIDFIIKDDAIIIDANLFIFKETIMLNVKISIIVINDYFTTFSYYVVVADFRPNLHWDLSYFMHVNSIINVNFIIN